MTQGQHYECHKLDTQEQVFFYEQDFYVLSNFSSFKVKRREIVFDTSEHAYHFERFYHPHNANAHSACSFLRNALALGTKSAHEAFRLAQENKHLQRTDWGDIKCSVMLETLWAKVHQHEYVMKKLMETGDRELVEDSWRDSFWGWGEDHNGRNMLGQTWMTVRQALKMNYDLFVSMPWVKSGKKFEWEIPGRPA